MTPDESQSSITLEQKRLLDDMVDETNRQTSRFDLRNDPYVVVKVDKIIHNHLCQEGGVQEDDLRKVISNYEGIYRNSGWRIDSSFDDSTVYTLSPTEYHEESERRRLARIKRNRKQDYSLIWTLVSIIFFPISMPIFIGRIAMEAFSAKHDTKLEKENRFNLAVFPFLVILVTLSCWLLFSPLFMK